jgi:hypothetical protein
MGTFVESAVVDYRSAIVSNKLPVADFRLPPSSDYRLWRTKVSLPITISAVISVTFAKQTQKQIGRQTGERQVERQAGQA